MKQTVKRTAFGLLLAACVAAAVLLFWIEDDVLPPTERPDEEVVETSEEPDDDTADVATPTPEQPDDEHILTGWSTYHGDNALRGVAPWTYPDELAVQWDVMTGAPVRVSPVADDTALFAVTTRGVAVAADREGNELWRRELTIEAPGHDTPQPIYVDAPITVVEGRLFIGCDFGNVFALDTATGEELWRTNIGGPVRGAPNYSADRKRLFVIEQDLGELVCLDMKDGAELWRSKGVDRSDGSPAVAGEVVVFGSCASALHVVSEKNGDRLRDIPIANGGGQVAGGVALVDGHAYAGVRDGRIMRGDVGEGTFTWITQISEDEVFSTPAVYDTQVLATCYDGFIYALDRETGEIQWQRELAGKPSSPVIVGGKALVAAGGVLYMLQLEEGAVLWELALGDKITGPAVLPDMLVVGSEEGVLTALQ